MKNTLVARVDPSLKSTWEWFQFQKELVTEAFAHALESTSPTVRSTPRPYDGRFLAREPAWIKTFFARQVEELELLASFEMIATVEAILRLDIGQRVTKRLKDPVSQQFRRVTFDRARLDEDILEIWKQEAGVNVSDFRSALKLRHWLAHGRHWHPKLGRGFKADEIYLVSSELLAAIRPLN